MRQETLRRIDKASDTLYRSISRTSKASFRERYYSYPHFSKPGNREQGVAGSRSQNKPEASLKPSNSDFTTPLLSMLLAATGIVSLSKIKSWQCHPHFAALERGGPASWCGRKMWNFKFHRPGPKLRPCSTEQQVQPF